MKKFLFLSIALLSAVMAVEARTYFEDFEGGAPARGWHRHHGPHAWHGRQLHLGARGAEFAPSQLTPAEIDEIVAIAGMVGDKIAKLKELKKEERAPLFMKYLEQLHADKEFIEGFFKLRRALLPYLHYGPRGGGLRHHPGAFGPGRGWAWSLAQSKLAEQKNSQLPDERRMLEPVLKPLGSAEPVAQPELAALKK